MNTGELSLAKGAAARLRGSNPSRDLIPRPPYPLGERKHREPGARMPAAASLLKK
jgi:hypothetical protein